MSKTRQKLRFAFMSSGVQDILKIIDYDYAGLYHNKKTFNLGFGDYDLTTNQINDKINTENGDVYPVFNTVLNTIPIFFENYPGHLIMVSGSDSGADFINRCKPDCRKKCLDEECKNQNRRINVYTRYVNKNYDELIKEYTFLGGNEDAVEPFEKDKKYDTVFVYKKITNFEV